MTDRYFVDMPAIDFTAGMMSGSRVIEAESADEARRMAGAPAMEAFPETAPFRAVRVPGELLGLSNEEIVDHYEALRRDLPEKKFYRKVMGIKGYKPQPKAPAVFYVGDRQVSEEEFFDQ